MTTDEFNRCVDQYSDGIYRFILKNIKDKDKAKDIVQDTFEKVWINRNEVEFLKAKSYLFSAAYHTMIDVIRRDKKQEPIAKNHKLVSDESKDYSDLKEVLQQALEILPEDQRSVIMLRDYEGYSYDEIAKITGLSESAVKVYIYRGRMALKNYLVSIENLV